MWQNKNDEKEQWAVRADRTLLWSYKGVPVIGISNSTVEYTYWVDPSKSPAHLDLIHRGVMGITYCIYEVTGDELRIGISAEKSVPGNRPKVFGATDRYYKRMRAEDGK